MNIKRFLTGAATSVIMLGAMITPVLADTYSQNFESFTLGTVNGQDGWSSLGSIGSGCAVYDHAVSPALGTIGFDSKSLRISNAVTSGCFGDQTFSKSLTDEVGETTATNAGLSGGVRQDHFEMQFDIASALPNSQQPGLFMSLSPDRGDGSRMSYLGFEDVAGGINIIFYDTPGTTNPANFSVTDLGTFPRNVSHNIKLTLDAIDGPSNDVVKVWIDGVLVHTGSSWENYFRFDSEALPEAGPRTVDSILFRTGGAAAATNGNGFLIDNLSLSSGPIPVDPFAVPAACSAMTFPNAPIIGTNGSDKINGTSGNDLIFALGDSDKVDGKGGNDCIVGGHGSDKLSGGTGNDVLIGGDGSDSLRGDLGNDFLYGDNDSDSLSGGSGNDSLSGGDGSDSLKGDSDDDTLVGDAGSDSAKGGSGTDACTAESVKQCES